MGTSSDIGKGKFPVVVSGKEIPRMPQGSRSSSLQPFNLAISHTANHEQAAAALHESIWQVDGRDQMTAYMETGQQPTLLQLFHWH